MIQGRMRGVLVILFGVGLAVSISLAEVMAGLFLLDWAVRSLFPARRIPWQPRSLDLPLFIFFGWGLLTAWVVPGVSFVKSLTAQSAFLLYYLAAHGLEDEDLRTLTGWFLAASVLMGFLGILQNVLNIVYTPSTQSYSTPAFFSQWPRGLLHFLANSTGRSYGSRSHPLTFAESLIPAVFILLFLAIGHCAGAKRVRGTYWLGLMLVLSGILFSQSRGVWLGVGLGLFTVVAFLPRRIGLLLLGLGVMMGGAVLLGSPQMRGRLLSSFASHAGTVSDQDSKEIRLQIWAAAREEFRSHPVFGTGIKNFALWVLDPTTHQSRAWTEAHSNYVQVALEGGWLGLGLWLWLMILVGLKTLGADRSIRPFLLATWVAFVVAGLTESWLRDQEVSMIFWGFAGVLLRLKNEQLTHSVR